MRIEYSNNARRDLRNIYNYITYTLCSPQAATSVVDKIMASIRNLEFFPEKHPVYPEEPWESRLLRYITIQNYVVFYSYNIDIQCISIIRIIYGGRNLIQQL